MAVVRLPRPPLRDAVRTYYGFREATGRPLQRREGPGADVVVVLSFGHEWRIDGARHTSFVGGLHGRQVETEHAGHAHGIQVDLPPPVARGLFRVPMHELAGRTAALEDLFGGEVPLLVERLAEARTWDERFALLDDTWSRRLAEAPPPPPGVTWAYGRLRATHGRVRVGELARELGWSRTRLAAEFREHVGLPSKTVARMLRFERAAALSAEGRRSWAEIAFACGYYDQSHLVTEFRAIAGRAPVEFTRDAGETVTFFQDARRLAS